MAFRKKRDAFFLNFFVIFNDFAASCRDIADIAFACNGSWRKEGGRRVPIHHFTRGCTVSCASRRGKTDSDVFFLGNTCVGLLFSFYLFPNASNYAHLLTTRTSHLHKQKTTTHRYNYAGSVLHLSCVVYIIARFDLFPIHTNQYRERQRSQQQTHSTYSSFHKQHSTSQSQKHCK